MGEQKEKEEVRYVEMAYARVSTTSQSLERQEASIMEAVPELKAMYFYEDRYTGKTFDRPKYVELKEKIEELLEANPDTKIRVTIHELDRIGRDYQEIQKEVYWFREKGVVLRFLDIPEEMIGGAMGITGGLLVDIIILLKAYWAEQELHYKEKRTREGIEKAKERGVKFGRQDKTVINVLKAEDFGKKNISEIKTSEAKKWLISLQDGGRSYSSIHSIRGVVRPAFAMAVEDDLLRKNPFDFELAKVLINDSVKRDALTAKQERDYLKFIKEDNHFSQFYDGIFLLFKTGLRISELCGLTIRDIDLKERTINIEKQLQYVGGKAYIERTKTTSGTRVLPMSDEVYETLKRVLSSRKKPKVESMIDGVGGFLFLDNKNKPMLAYQWEKKFQHSVEKYNKIYKVELPKITPHVCRHTYCTNMAKSGISVKTLQYLMGHSDISVTMNVYTHLKLEDAKDELEKLKIKENLKKEMALAEMEYAKKELKRVQVV